MKDLVVGIVIGFVVCAVIIIGISVIVALDNDNEYLDYPPEDMEYDRETECEKDNWRDFR